MLKKHCNGCNTDKDVEFFAWKNKSKDKRQSSCKSCQKIYKDKHYVNNRMVYLEKQKITHIRIKKERLKILVDYLLQHPCVDCGENDPLVLQFDHVKETKKYSISTLFSGHYGWPVIDAELQKCEVRCANCHMRVTARRAGWGRITILDKLSETA